MAPITSASTDDTHAQLLNTLDLASLPRPFRAAGERRGFRVTGKRNKTVKTILSEATRAQHAASTSNNSGTSTPRAGAIAAAAAAGTLRTVVPPAAPALSSALLQARGAPARPTSSYTSLEAGPSLHPSSARRYCDLTGLPAPYTDPKSRLRYACAEVFAVLRTLPGSTAEMYLAARGAAVVLR